MLNVPDSEHEDRVQGRSVSEFDSDNIQQVLHTAFAQGFPRFAQILWGVLSFVLVCFVLLHIVVALHWVVPGVWLNATELGNLEQKIAMLYGRVGGWVFPLVVSVWQIWTNSRE